MKKKGKILVTNIRADIDREQSIREYLGLISAAFVKYSAIKLSLNYFTLNEMVIDMSGAAKEECLGYLGRIDGVLKSVFSGDYISSSEDIDIVTSIRDTIIDRMKILTSYTDALEIFEYILNRKEDNFSEDEPENVDPESLADLMYTFVFSDDDKMDVNARVQSFIAQLPVRITKQRFYDIISSSLEIYRGGEKSSVDSFAEMIESSALINRPEGFEYIFPDLYDAFTRLKEQDYKELTSASFDELTELIGDSSRVIRRYVTGYMMLQEIVNDVLVILYNRKYFEKDESDIGFSSAVKIIESVASHSDIYEAAEETDELFVNLEGAQEEMYDIILSLTASFDEAAEYAGEYEDEILEEHISAIRKADRLTSSSLFMDIEDDSEWSVVDDPADDEYIDDIKDRLTREFDELFIQVSKDERRSIMAKILSAMPVFFNSREEIREYFVYALSRCTDKAELSGAARLIRDIIDDE